MREPYHKLHFHFVWSTWDREPWITPDVEQEIFAVMIAKATALGATVLAVGGVIDHVHLLVGFPPALAPANFVGQVKGVSSHAVNHAMRPGSDFRWQGGYGVFSVSESGVETVRDYVLSQRERHARGAILEAWERTEAPSE